MANFLYEPKGVFYPKGKPKVFFTCHPDDFDKYFHKVCEDILKTHECAVFYTEKPDDVIEDKYKESDLGQMNLFVIPVTLKLLTEPNRAIDSDLQYAKEKCIPVLPLMMESGLDAVYSREDKFGELQYLNPYDKDGTAIGYEEKLKKYLDKVLVSDQIAEKVRKAFDAFVFLSYRKKDRHYANELMKLIHKHPQFRDIAIWYDEFLVPGESFREGIETMMKESKLFTLLVTPSLLEYVDGKKNYVMGCEYPHAKKANMGILPVEMEDTDKKTLGEKYEEIPACVNAYDDILLEAQLSDALAEISLLANDDDPEHKFYIGLAYLEGIDVEVDKERGLEMITSAAKLGCILAMEKLFDMYRTGIGVKIDYRQAVIWAKKIAQYKKDKYGERSSESLIAANNLAVAYCDLGNQENYKKALQIYKRIYDIRMENETEQQREIAEALHNIAHAYTCLGEYGMALEMHKKACDIISELDNVDYTTMFILFADRAVAYGMAGNYKESLKLLLGIYDLQRDILGYDNPNTVLTLSNLGVIYGNLGEAEHGVELLKKAYDLQSKILGETARVTMQTLSNLAVAYSRLGTPEGFNMALELQTKANTLQAQTLGDNHPDTLSSGASLASAYFDLGRYEEALKQYQEVYEKTKDILGKDNPVTLKLLNNFATVCHKNNQPERAISMFEEAYRAQCDVLAKDHPDTIDTLENLANAHFGYFLSKKSGAHFYKAKSLLEKLYGIYVKKFGSKDPKTIELKGNIDFLRKLCK